MTTNRPTTYRVGQIWGAKPTPPDLPGPQLVAFVIGRLGITRQDLAYALSLHPNTTRRWLVGSSAPHKAARKALEAIRAVTITPDSMSVTFAIPESWRRNRQPPKFNGAPRETDDGLFLENTRRRLGVSRREIAFVLATNYASLSQVEYGKEPLHDVTRQYLEGMRSITVSPQNLMCVTYSLAKLPPNRIRRRKRPERHALNPKVTP